MRLLPVCLFLCCVTLPCDCYHLNKTLCEGSSCFYLYESNNSYLTWDQSYDACINQSLEMLRIESNQTQTVIDNLLHAVPQDTDRKVWIGGRRSTDNTWRFMNGTVFSNTVHVQTSETDLYCLYVTLCKGYNIEYSADNCDEKTSHSRLFCQYEPNKTSNCRSSDVLYGNKCYMKTQYNGNESNKIDWYNGETYCSQSDIQGDIAYSYLDDDTLINNIIDLVHPGYDCVQLWLGVRTRIWFWKTASNTDEDLNAINYYKWDPRTNLKTSDGDCIYIDLDKGNNWFAGSCTDPPLKYFVCMKNNASIKETTTTTTTTATNANASKTATSKTTLTVLPTDNPTGNRTENSSRSGNNGKSSFKSGYVIAIVVVGVVVLAVVVGLVVFFVLRKRKKSVQEDGFVSKNVHNPSTKQSDAEDPQYDDIEFSGDHDDVIDPYGVVGAENGKKADVRYKEAPSGELYAISSKQVKKMDVNKNEEDDKPEVVYAQPEKKKKQTPKTYENSEESGTAKPGNDVITESPSAGEAGSGSKHTEHFEAPSGEVYARVIKNGNDSDD